MSDEESPVDPKALAPVDRYAESLLYDFSKFLTTLSLLSLGGVLSLTQAANRADVKLFNIALVLGTISLAGVLALSTANGLVEARAAGSEPKPHLRRWIQGAMALLCIGMGGFIMMWWDNQG